VGLDRKELDAELRKELRLRGLEDRVSYLERRMDWWQRVTLTVVFAFAGAVVRFLLPRLEALIDKLGPP